MTLQWVGNPLPNTGLPRFSVRSAKLYAFTKALAVGLAETVTTASTDRFRLGREGVERMTFTNSATATRWQPYTFRDQSWLGTDLTGYKIQALDGDIGKVDEATYETGSSHLIVDTGPFIFGKKVMLPAGVVSRIDHQNKGVWVDRTKDQIKNAPEFDESMLNDNTYRQRLGDYYGEGGAGWYSDR